jgi:hypothetical protein
VVPCANAGTAITDAIIIMNINIPNFRIVFLLMNCRQWVVDVIPYRRPHAGSSGQWPVVSGQISKLTTRNRSLPPASTFFSWQLLRSDFAGH